MLQTIVAGLIVAAAAVWLLWLLGGRVRSGHTCNCPRCDRRASCSGRDCPPDS